MRSIQTVIHLYTMFILHVRSNEILESVGVLLCFNPRNNSQINVRHFVELSVWEQGVKELARTLPPLKYQRCRCNVFLAPISWEAFVLP